MHTTTTKDVGRTAYCERLAILEQIFLAALDVHNEELANQCLSRIHHYLRSTVGEDSSSARIQRLVALQKESMADYDGALEIYDTLLHENPANSSCYQRKYAIFKAQVGKEVEAMEAMNSYLSKQNQGDAAAWFEMANLCTNVGDYKGATLLRRIGIASTPRRFLALYVG